MKQQRGFTLVELAIVLVIIGLILGMAFKGKDLIDGAKVKNMQAQYNKIVAGFNIYYEKYGAYPGDGCIAAVVALGGGTTCPAGNRDGILGNAFETQSAINLLLNTNILTNADIQSVFGQPWAITPSADVTLVATGTNFMSLTNAAGVPQAAADVRFVCALDRLMDDGVNTTGIVRSTGLVYTAATDCWAQTGQVTVGVRVLP
ncbi:type II secretion system protein [Deefgea rivuli]|uniref:type II secretion system protein n=1 Tax=Deefgea rivuli TaxID=400948 RepID=UPI0006857727|nr:prepilin-type N-terminal cleavage/methylation domain-containing protein [Deefgea rivuli]